MEGVVGWIGGIAASVIVAAVTAAIALRLEREKMREMLKVEREKLREEMKLDYAIETAIRHLLENENYQRRSLSKIKRHLKGFKTDDQLRMAMIRAGAVVISGDGEEELWGLLERNLDAVK